MLCAAEKDRIGLRKIVGSDSDSDDEEVYKYIYSSIITLTALLSTLQLILLHHFGIRGLRGKHAPLIEQVTIPSTKMCV